MEREPAGARGGRVEPDDQNGLPATGAGNLETPGQTDVYTIALAAGQKVYADGANPCGGGFQDLRWTLRAGSGTVIFPTSPGSNTLGQLTGCVDDVGEVTIPATDTYTLTVSGFNGAMGTYTATLWNANPPAPVAVVVGDTVSNGVPVAGAGNLETPGQTDTYTFTATAGQVVNFDGLNPCGGGFPDLRWTVKGPVEPVGVRGRRTIGLRRPTPATRRCRRRAPTSSRCRG